MSCRLLLLGNGKEKSNRIDGLLFIYGSHFRIQGGPPDHGTSPPWAYASFTFCEVEWGCKFGG